MFHYYFGQREEITLADYWWILCSKDYIKKIIDDKKQKHVVKFEFPELIHPNINHSHNYNFTAIAMIRPSHDSNENSQFWIWHVNYMTVLKAFEMCNLTCKCYPS